MLYLTCTTISSVDLAHYGLSRAKDLVSVDCGTSKIRSLSFSYEFDIVKVNAFIGRFCGC